MIPVPNYIYVKNNNVVVAKLPIPTNTVFNNVEFCITDSLSVIIQNDSNSILFKIKDNNINDLVHITNIYKEDL